MEGSSVRSGHVPALSRWVIPDAGAALTGLAGADPATLSYL